MSTRRRRRAEEHSTAVAVEKTKVGKGTWIWVEGGRLVETRPLPPEPMSESNAEEAEDEEWIMSSYDALPLIASNRPLPLRWPEFPEGGSWKEIAEWNKACDRVDKLAADDPVTYPPILRGTKDDFDTSSSTSDLYSASSNHREKIVGLARSIVSISSTRGDGSLNWRFNGIIIGPSGVDERTRILTSSETVCDCQGILDHKLRVRLPNKDIKEAEVLCFDDYYGLAILDISGGMPLWSPTFVSSSDYGDEVFVLTRNKDSSLITTTGKVLWHSEPYFGRNHYLYLSCDLPKRISGALVMDRDGNICGMTVDCGSPKTAVLPSFIIRNLIEMLSKFRCIVRPVHGLSLRAVEFLGMSRREDILYKHNIRSGYLVDEVEMDSIAETIGIRRGDVIVSVNGMRFQNVLELEEYFLSLGWKFLEKKNESFKVVLKLKVYDPLNCQENTLSLPLGFSSNLSDTFEIAMTHGWPRGMTHGIRMKELMSSASVLPRERSDKTEKTIASASHGIKRKSNTSTAEPMSSGRVLRPRKKSEKK